MLACLAYRTVFEGPEYTVVVVPVDALFNLPHMSLDLSTYGCSILSNHFSNLVEILTQFQLNLNSYSVFTRQMAFSFTHLQPPCVLTERDIFSVTQFFLHSRLCLVM